MFVISGNFDLAAWEAGFYCIFPSLTIYLQLHFIFELAKFNKNVIRNKGSSWHPLWDRENSVNSASRFQ